MSLTEFSPLNRLPSMTIRIAHRTDIGCVRQVNEDSYLVFEPVDPFQLAARGKLLVVADGMGGTIGGDTASRLVVKSIKEAYFADEDSDLRVSQALIEAVRRANMAVFEYAQHHEAYRGMGSTCTALAIHGRHAYFGHVGDSRLYVIRNHRIIQLTKDHSKVAQMVLDGQISADEAEFHPERNVIMRWIGSDPDVKVDTSPTPLELQAGDRVLMCSDGLTSHVTDAELLRLIDQRDPRQAVDRLIDLTKTRGGSDNITVILVQVVRVVSPVEMETNAPLITAPPPPPPPPKTFTSPMPTAAAATGESKMQHWRFGLLLLAVVMSTLAVGLWILDKVTTPDPPEGVKLASRLADDPSIGSTSGNDDGAPSLASKGAPSQDKGFERDAPEPSKPPKKESKIEELLAPEPEGDRPDKDTPNELLPELPMEKPRGPLKGPLLRKAIARVNNPSNPVCKELRDLIAEKVDVDPGVSTEVFVQAVARYQKANGLFIVGNPGPQTRTHMFGADNRRQVCVVQKREQAAKPPEKAPEKAPAKSE